MSSKPGKRARARAQLVDQLEQKLLTFKPLLKLLEAVGIDPANTHDVKQVVSSMLVGLYHGISRIERQPRQTTNSKASGARKWSLVHDMALKLEVEWW